MRFPTHVTMNTYATSARFCAYADRSCNRLCTPEELPGVLRTGPYSEIVPEHLPRSEKGGDTTIHGQSTEMIQAVQDSTFEGGESGDSVERRLIYCQSRDTDDNEGPQALNQSSAPEGNEQQGAIKECTPVALRTRSCRQQESSIRNKSGKGEFGQDTERNEDKELIQLLTTQNKEQQNTIDELSSAVKEFLRVQSTVKKLQGNIKKLSEQLESQEKFKVPISTNHQIVKPFTPQNSADDLHHQTHAENQTSVLKTRGQQFAECELRCQGSEIETCTSESKTRRRKTRADTKIQPNPMDAQEMYNKLKSMLNPWQIKGIDELQSQVDHQAEALRKHRNASRESMDKLEHEDKGDLYIDSDGEVAVYNRYSNPPDDLYYDSDASEEEPRKEKNQHIALVATPQRRSKATSIGHSDSHAHTDSHVTDIYNIDHLESIYVAAGMRDKFLLDKKEMMRRKIQDEKFESNKALAAFEDPKSDTSGSVNEDSETEPESESPTPQSTHLKKSVSKPQGYKRDPFVVPKYPKVDRAEAYAKVSAALDQVDPSVHLNLQGARSTATLYVGNLEFNASENDLRKSLDRVFKRIRVEKITIPKVQGRSKYGFIEISWARRAPVKTIDLCIMYSGMIQVNSRPIYLRELRGKGDKN